MDIPGVGQPTCEGGLLDTVSRSPAATARRATDAERGDSHDHVRVADHGSSEIGARGLLDGLRSGQAPQLEISQLGSLWAIRRRPGS